MPDGAFEVKPLFVEPVFTANIADIITPDQIAWLKDLKMVQNRTNLISENLYIFNEPEMKSISDAVQQALDSYAANVMGISDDQRLYVTQSWTLINEPGIGMHGHTHSNSVVSGSLYFTDMPQPVARMVFNRHRTYQQLELSASEGRQNLYNTNVNVIEPKRGDLILFSSSLQHYVETNMANERRYSIAFNTFVKGTLGSLRDVSQLHL